MVAEVRGQHKSEWAAITALAELLGVGSAETVREHGCRIASSTYYGHGARRPSARQRLDKRLTIDIRRVYENNFGV
jgi:hypothetical protein